LKRGPWPHEEVGSKYSEKAKGCLFDQTWQVIDERCSLKKNSLNIKSVRAREHQLISCRKKDKEVKGSTKRTGGVITKTRRLVQQAQCTKSTVTGNPALQTFKRVAQ